jgi:hypothetical protein
MSKPQIHAQSSVKKFGGKVEDYLPIHNRMDSSKGAIADNRHRALTHNSWFLSTILEFLRFPNSCEPDAEGRTATIINSDGKHVSVRDIGEQHILEDFKMKFIPAASDYLSEMEFKAWMQNAMGGNCPPSCKKLKLGQSKKSKELPNIEEYENKEEVKIENHFQVD